MSHDESSADGPGAEREPTTEAELVPAGDDAAIAAVDPAQGELGPAEPLGLIDKFKLASLRSRKELEAVELVLDARIAVMRHQADAATRESKAYWDAKTADVVSAMKTFVQAKLRAVENERMSSRMDSLQGAYELFAAKVREVETGALPEELRGDLIQRMRKNLTETIERLESDALAAKYDLED